MESGQGKKVRIAYCRRLLVSNPQIIKPSSEDLTSKPNADIANQNITSSTSTSSSSHQSLQRDQSVDNDIIHNTNNTQTDKIEAEIIMKPEDIGNRRRNKRKGSHYESSNIVSVDSASSEDEKPMKRRLKTDYTLEQQHCKSLISKSSSVYNVSSEDSDNDEKTIKVPVENKIMYSVMFAKPSTKKHKVWQGDGYLIQSGQNLTLKDSEGKILGSATKFNLTDEMINEAKVFVLGGKEVQIQSMEVDRVPMIQSQKEHFELTKSKILPVDDKVCAGEDSSDNDEKCVEESVGKKTIYSVMFAKPSTRKHKIWQGDGYLIHCGKDLTLKDTEGKILGSASKFNLTEEMISEAKTFVLGGKEVQIQDEVEDHFGID